MAGQENRIILLVAVSILLGRFPVARLPNSVLISSVDLTAERLLTATNRWGRYALLNSDRLFNSTWT